MGRWAVGDVHQRRRDAVTAQVDHLVIAASTLDEGVAWCESTLGISPGPGGEHPLMGTHNRLLSIASPSYPGSYFEIIAINTGAAYAHSVGSKRWFDLENEAVQLSLTRNGPQFIHFVARSGDVTACTQALTRLGIDRGELLTASRMTAQGLLSWKITVRPDGQRLFSGMLPTLIEWGDVHPTQHMAPCGVTLQTLVASQSDAAALQSAFTAIDLQGVALAQGQPNLVATLQTPRGLVTLESKGL